MVIYLNDRSTVINHLEGDADSDCEGDSVKVWDGASGTEEGEKEQTRAVLTTGSFSAYVYFLPFLRLERNDGFSSWKSLFFYRCTDAILFAPLKSQGFDPRLNYIRGMNTTAVPPPCSPKGIYVLASLVRNASIKRFTYDTDMSIKARNPAPLRQSIRRHQEQGDFGQCRRRGFLAGHC